jgi:hypothetical protein
MLWKPKHDFLMAAAARYYGFRLVQPSDFLNQRHSRAANEETRELWHPRPGEPFLNNLDDLRAHERPLLSRADFVRKLVAEAKRALQKSAVNKVRLLIGAHKGTGGFSSPASLQAR